MAYVDRYLKAVGSNLPRDHRDDIIRELSDNLNARMEDRVDELGRDLTEDEQVAILREFGEPMAVAARYRGDGARVSFGRQLIGPELYPIYRNVLAINIVITVAIGLLALVIALTGADSPFGVGYGILVPLVLQFAIVTALFVVIDRWYRTHPDAWDPRTVSDVGGPDFGSLDGWAEMLIGPERDGRAARAAATFELGAIAIFATWWVAFSSPASIGPVAPGPGWSDFEVPILALFVLWAIPSIGGLLRPDARRFRSFSRVAADVATIVVSVASLAAGDWLVAAPGFTGDADIGELVGLINGIVRVSLAAVVALTAVSLVLEVRRLRRQGGPTLD
jgi:hypothetical protein